VTITIETGPVDEHGHLVHAEDPTAQLCLALVRLETALRERELGLSDIVSLRLFAVDIRLAADLFEVVAERFVDAAVRPTIRWVDADRLDDPDMLVALAADVRVTAPAAGPESTEEGS
jgi:enamine deaminase RidA (YjgF/YER057c/UK114 family)